MRYLFFTKWQKIKKQLMLKMKQLFWVVVKLHKHLARISAQSLEIKGVSLSHAADFRVCRRPEREEQKNKNQGREESKRDLRVMWEAAWRRAVVSILM